MLIIYVPMLKDHINSLSVVTHIFLCHNLACREPWEVAYVIVDKLARKHIDMLSPENRASTKQK